MTGETAYDELRAWYLARLRKQALAAEDGCQLTPKALITADREHVQNLILAHSQKSSRLPGGSFNCARRRGLDFLLAFLLSAYLLLVYFQFCGRHLSADNPFDVAVLLFLLIPLLESFRHSRG